MQIYKHEIERAILRARLNEADLHVNADMGPSYIRDFYLVDQTSTHLLKTAMRQMQLSAQAYYRILKSARTIADLAGEVDIQTSHVAEVIQYRPRQQV